MLRECGTPSLTAQLRFLVVSSGEAEQVEMVVAICALSVLTQESHFDQFSRH